MKLMRFGWWVDVWLILSFFLSSISHVCEYVEMWSVLLYNTPNMHLWFFGVLVTGRQYFVLVTLFLSSRKREKPLVFLLLKPYRTIGCLWFLSQLSINPNFLWFHEVYISLNVFKSEEAISYVFVWLKPFMNFAKTHFKVDWYIYNMFFFFKKKLLYDYCHSFPFLANDEMLAFSFSLDY